ncbi:hypothetical protein ABZ079_27655 [Streptomyces sp. NPDC006314]
MALGTGAHAAEGFLILTGLGLAGAHQSRPQVGLGGGAQRLTVEDSPPP